METLDIALKEWAVTCAALADGEQIFLVRKGGIHERHGKFAIDHERFWLFPGHEHEKPELLKSPWNDRCGRKQNGESITLSHVCELVEVHPAPATIQGASRLMGLSIWGEEFFKIRYEYKPQLPLYVVVLRVRETDSPQSIENQKRYAGCRSWVPLGVEIPTGNLAPVMDDDAFEIRRAELLKATT
jgi:hypothetical protein